MFLPLAALAVTSVALWLLVAAVLMLSIVVVALAASRRTANDPQSELRAEMTDPARRLEIARAWHDGDLLDAANRRRDLSDRDAYRALIAQEFFHGHPDAYASDPTSRSPRAATSP